MYCPKCGAANKNDAKFCVQCGKAIIVDSQDKPSEQGDVEVVEALKAPNTCCLWVSLDYWNLYIVNDRAMAVRLYRGWWGLIGFIIGLMCYIIGFIVFSALGILIDRNIGGGKCTIMNGKIKEILSNRNRYKIYEVTLDKIKKIETSDLCLGNLWLKYMVNVGGKKLYFENSKYQQIEKIIKQNT